MIRQVLVRVSGKVQGVYFRAETKAQAEALGVVGFVRNLPDGCVEALFCGEASSTEAMIAWCRKGPPLARVTNVEIWEEEADVEAFSSFVII